MINVNNFIAKHITKRDRSMFLSDIKNLQRNHPIKGGKDLSQNIDKILYGKK